MHNRTDGLFCHIAITQQYNSVAAQLNSGLGEMIQNAQEKQARSTRYDLRNQGEVVSIRQHRQCQMTCKQSKGTRNGKANLPNEMSEKKF